MKVKSSSLFYKIFISFLMVILLVASFNVLSFAFFKKNIQDEIIRYNRMILENTVDKYDNHFQTVKGILFSTLNDDKVTAFGRQLRQGDTDKIDYLLAREIHEEVQSSAYNRFLHLDNFLIYFQNTSLVIDKEGTSEASRMFSQYYVSEAYPAAFWQKQLRKTNKFSTLPGALFTVGSFDLQTKHLIPLTVKNPEEDYQVIAFLDAQKLHEAFHGMNNPEFMILNDERNVLYRSSDNWRADELPEFTEGRDYNIRDDFHYFFVQKNGLMYVTRVPFSSIASQVKKLNYTLLFILLLSVAVGVMLSIFFGRRINRPVKHIVSSVLRREPAVLQSKINEFDLINKNVHDLIHERNEIHNDLIHKKSLLTSYGYISKLKRIDSNLKEWKDFDVASGPFMIVLYQLSFRSASLAEIGIVPDRASYCLRQFIAMSIEKKFSASHTFQIEDNQLLSVILGGNLREDLKQTLELLKQVFDGDRQYYLVTAAISSEYQTNSEYNEAYQEVLEMAAQAKLADATQLIFDAQPSSRHSFWSVAQEQKFYSNLQAGNDGVCVSLICRILEQMYRKETAALQFRQFAESIVMRTANLLGAVKIEIVAYPQFQTLQQELKECFTLDEYNRFFMHFIAFTTSLIKSKKEGRDDISSFVMEYIESNYHEDISLDSLAYRLNMSSAYLSVCIKDKTGVNFSDHLNNVRVRKAKELLRTSDLSIQVIGTRIGYRNVTSFIRMFKKITGETPGDFRKGFHIRLDAHASDGEV